MSNGSPEDIQCLSCPLQFMTDPVRILVKRDELTLEVSAPIPSHS